MLRGNKRAAPNEVDTVIGSSVTGPTICCCDVCIFSNFIILGAVAGMSRMLE